MADIKFRDTAHRDFFLENMMKCRVNDCYHRAFFYVMGIASETRANINQMFNFKEDCIEPEGMHGGWQTSGTVKVCHLAFNLWNGYAEEGRERYFTPEEFGRFYRGKQSAGVDGVGIGLYLTRDIVNKQNGYIKVASDEKGTIFSLFLKKV